MLVRGNRALSLQTRKRVPQNVTRRRTEMTFSNPYPRALGPQVPLSEYRWGRRKSPEQNRLIFDRSCGQILVAFVIPHGHPSSPMVARYSSLGFNT